MINKHYSLFNPSDLNDFNFLYIGIEFLFYFISFCISYIWIYFFYYLLLHIYKNIRIIIVKIFKKITLNCINIYMYKYHNINIKKQHQRPKPKNWAKIQA